ncbi:MAG: HpsJ family protein [Pleurocapsa sp.]
MLKYRLWRIKKSFSTQTNSNLQYKKLSIQVEQESTKIVNIVGYIILAVVLINYAFLLVSAQFFNSNWVHSTTGNLVENGWGILLGFLFIFYRRDQDIVKPKEIIVLKVISWLTLLMGIGYFLLAPLVIGNAFRIHRAAKAQVLTQVNAASSQVELYSQQLDNATDQQLAVMLKKYQQQAPGLDINSGQQLKETLSGKAQEKQQQAKKALQKQLKVQQKSLFKTTAKWAMIATLTGMCLMLIWKYTAWARVKY